jgi:hypothetical protein
MTEAASLRSKAIVIQVLRRAGYRSEVLAELQRTLPDPVDLERDQELLTRHGIDRSHLVDRLGGSP